ncbi:MAG TPA: hypothetical protein VFE05_00530 [Longimicrobiaceae bacterium]|nr:hypothetical protein [Longimicrobiaceae bacterium]
MVDILAKIGLAIATLWFTYTYNRQQTQIQEYQRRLQEVATVNTLLPYVFSQDTVQAAAAFYVMRSDSALHLAYKVADHLPPEMQSRLLQRLSPHDLALAARTGVSSPSGTPFGQALEQQFTSALTHGSPSSLPEANTVHSGWIYLGTFDAKSKQWQTRYLAFPLRTPPDLLAHESFKVTEANGALNVRKEMLSIPNVLPPAIDSIEPNHRVRVEEVREWVDTDVPTGYMWARVTY